MPQIPTTLDEYLSTYSGGNNPNLCQLAVNANASEYSAAYRNGVMIWSIEGNAPGQLESFVNNLYRQFRNIVFDPAPGSLAFEELSNCYIQQEEEMPASASRAEPPDEYSIVISWNETKCVYIIHAPAQNILGYVTETARTLDDAYLMAKEFVYRFNRALNASGNYKVWPRRNSLHYKALVSAFKIPNPSNIQNYADLRRSFENIRLLPSNPEMQNVINNIILYILWKKYGRSYDDIKVDKTRNKVKSILKTITGIDFIELEEDVATLAHPANVVSVIWSRQDVNDVHYFSAKAAREYAFKCCDCNKHIRKTLGYNVYSKKICSYCLEQRGIYFCDTCSDFHNIADACPRFLATPPSHIFNYSTDVRKLIPRMFGFKEGKFITPSEKTLKYGIELEVLRRPNTLLLDAVARIAKVTRKYAIIKSDSSLGADGFEIVTAPATLEFHRYQLWNDFFNMKDSNGKRAAEYVNAWDTGVCGTHIHISRSALTKMQLAKLLVFYHEDSNLGFLSKIAGRAVGPGARYCKTRKKKLGLLIEHQCDDHHEAICISSRNRGATAEVRIFRANATKHGIMRSLEFVDATVHWCAIAGANDMVNSDKPPYRRFLEWFDRAEVRTNYPDLWKHLMQLGYIKTPHTSKGKKTLDLIPEGERVA